MSSEGDSGDSSCFKCSCWEDEEEGVVGEEICISCEDFCTWLRDWLEERKGEEWGAAFLDIAEDETAVILAFLAVSLSAAMRDWI